MRRDPVAGRSAVALLAVLLGLATGCTATAPPPPGPPEAPGPVVEPVEAGPTTAVLDFGEPHTWASGDVMTVAEPVPADRPTTAPGYVRVLALEVSVVVGADGPGAVEGYRFVAAAEGPPVLDLPDPAGGAPRGPQPPGSTATWTVAVQLAVDGPTELELQVVDTADPQRPAVFYRGAA